VVVGQLAEGLGAMGGCAHRIAELLQSMAEQYEDVWIIIDHEDPWLGLIHRRCSYATAPGDR
jgi:hypothetical protein